MLQPKRKRPTVTPENRFAKAPPGFSLTGTPGKWPWERPPEFTTPSEAVDAVIENLENPDTTRMYLQLMAAGVSIEEMVGTIARAGFMEGKFTVDVGEIIKAPLAMYLMGLASKFGVDAKVFTTKTGFPRTNYGMEDEQILTIMKDRNPDLLKEVMKKGQQLNVQSRDYVQRQEMMSQESFLGVEEVPIEAELMEEGPMMDEPMPEDSIEGEQVQ